MSSLQDRLNEIDADLITINTNYIAADKEARYLYRILKSLLSRENQLLLNRLMSLLTDREIYGIKEAYLQGSKDQNISIAS